MSQPIKGPPGVGIRRGSPVVFEDENRPPAWDEEKDEYVAAEVFSGLAEAYDPIDGWDVFAKGFWYYEPPKPRDGAICLDLTDPTGFMHGVWAVAEALNLNAPASGSMQPTGKHTWTITTNRPRGAFPASGPPMSSYNTRFTYEINDAIRRMMDRPGLASLWVVVPELNDIPNDQPAEALAAIMRHVFEATP